MDATVLESPAKSVHLEALYLQNTKLQTSTAIEIAQALKDNKTLKYLNLSGNIIQPAGMRALAEMLKTNTSLLEVNLSNQKYATGTDAEQAFASSLQKNETLEKFSLLIRDVPSRTAIDRAMTRNKDVARRKRLEQSSS